ncbi:hypothetical protein EON67_03330 [archaeon]|nr:MAG: hypothetical protein EON67_03330 [archaeon]
MPWTRSQKKWCVICEVIGCTHWVHVHMDARARRARARVCPCCGVRACAVQPEEPFNLESFEGALRTWIDQPQTRVEVKRRLVRARAHVSVCALVLMIARLSRYLTPAPAPDVSTARPPATCEHVPDIVQRNFLETYTTMNGERVHDKVIDEMCAANSASLHVSYLHLSHHSPILAIWLADVPKQMLQLFDAVAQEVVLSRYRDYHMIADEIHVRIMQMPILDSLRDLRHAHLNALVKVSGVVTRRSAVHPQLRVVHYNCIKCGFTVGPIYHTDDREVRVRPRPAPPLRRRALPSPWLRGICILASPHALARVLQTNVGPCPSCLSPGPFSINQAQTIYRNYQKIVLQESPGTVPPGRVPRYKDVILVADLIDCVRSAGRAACHPCVRAAAPLSLREPC